MRRITQKKKKKKKNLFPKEDRQTICTFTRTNGRNAFEIAAKLSYRNPSNYLLEWMDVADGLNLMRECKFWCKPNEYINMIETLKCHSTVTSGCSKIGR